MTYIPANVLKKWKQDAQNRNETLLVDLIELREIIFESKKNGDKILMQIYTEASLAFNLSTGALQNKLKVIREYPDEKLIEWINKGIAIDTLKKINDMADVGMTSGELPADVVDRLIKQGNSEGKVPTADEAISLILEQNGIQSDEYKFNIVASRLATRWGVLDVHGFLVEFRELVNRYKVITKDMTKKPLQSVGDYVH